MKNYMFVCIGTNRLIEDSFGPRVGDILKQNFYMMPNIRVYGTMKKPIHFQNAPMILECLKQEQSKIIIIDSALGEAEKLGSTYINFGGIEIGKAFGKSLYMPAHLNIKTVVGLKPSAKICKVRIGGFIKEIINTNNMDVMEQKEEIMRVDELAQKLAMQIIHGVCAVV